LSTDTEEESMRATRSNPDTVAAPMGTYSQAVRVETGDAVWIHVSGQVAMDAEGNLVGPGDLRAQTRQVFENLKAILEANGATFADAVKIGTYLTTLDDLAGMREVRSEYLIADPPASTAVQVVALVVPEALIEIDLVAVVPA
jgi:2-iminobutanoate/2-iminopropanoate deaminase